MPVVKGKSYLDITIEFLQKKLKKNKQKTLKKPGKLSAIPS